MPQQISAAARLGHDVFIVTLLAKGLLGVAQLIAAAGVFLGVPQRLPALARWLVRNELAEDPNDYFAAHFVALADRLPGSDMTFYAVYFTAHGLLHLGVVAALLLRLQWAYPAAIAVLAGFIVYQLTDWLATGGVVLLGLSAIDAVVIWLTLVEWRTRHRG